MAGLWLGVAATAFAVGCLAVALVAPHAYYRVQRWEVTGAAVCPRRGWLTHTSLAARLTAATQSTPGDAT